MQLSVSDTDILRKEIRILPTGVESITVSRVCSSRLFQLKLVANSREGNYLNKNERGRHKWTYCDAI